jgi:uncharacterized SAM-binding protein YcdF (DUF218 family)
MGFIIAKVIMYLILPPASLLALILGGLVLARWRRSAGKVMVAAGIVLLYFLCLPPVADMLIRPLEAAFPPFHDPGMEVNAVVVLSGGAKDLSWVPAPAAPSEASLERLVAGMQIARTRRLPLVITGGSGEVTSGGVPEANAMADIAARLGFPAKDIIIENHSRNTVENAEKIKDLISGRTIILVTSAFHMKRSTRIFSKQDFIVLPAPAGYTSPSRPFSITFLIPRAGALDISATALSEYLSLAWYGMTGRL